MSISSCCVKGFSWSGETVGRIEKLVGNDVYVVGNNPEIAILFIADLFGWTFPNVRLLADHFAQEINATVFVPDFFGGEVLDHKLIAAEKFDQLNLPSFMERNGREQREEEIFESARALRRDMGFTKVGAVGYCYGGWASFRLGAKTDTSQQPLVDCISIGHPSMLTKEDIDGLSVPAQILAPEIDAAYSAEMKTYTFQALQNTGISFEYLHFPGVVHGCLVRGDEEKAGERAAMTRGKNAVVAWFQQWLLPPCTRPTSIAY